MDDGGGVSDEPVAAGVGFAVAGQVLGVGVDRVRQLVRSGDLVADLVRGRWVVNGESLEQLRVERGRWVTVKEAAAALGCSRGRIERAVVAGVLRRRPGATRAVASILKDDLAALGEVLDSEVCPDAERSAQEKDGGVAAEGWGRDRPPDEQHEWWTVARAAAAFGVSGNRVRQLVERDQLPATRRAGRIWIRRDHVLQVASARAFRAAQLSARRAELSGTENA